MRWCRATVAGSTSERRWRTSWSVAAACGAVVGLAVSTAVSPAALRTGAVTARSRGRPAARRGCGRPPPGRPRRSSTTTWIGPLKPGPKPSASWSKAMRWVVWVAALPSSGTPMRMLERRDGDGAQRAEADDGVADRVVPTWWAQRPENVSSAGLATWVLRWIDSLSIFVPARPSRPGSSVTAAAMETVTTSATAAPMPLIAGRPARNRPRMAMTTVVPANSTACPAVATAVPAASSTLMPRGGAGGAG